MTIVDAHDPVNEHFANQERIKQIPLPLGAKKKENALRNSSDDELAKKKQEE